MRTLPLALLLAACASSDDDAVDTDVVTKAFPTTIGGARPAPVVAPADVDATEALPAIVLLHGYGVTAELEQALFGLRDKVERDRFLLVLPEGTVDSGGFQFWNAGVDCCGDLGPPVDDVAYLGGLVDELRTGWNVSTVAFMGHSNGGYMSYRLACEAPETLDRMFVLAGAAPSEPVECVPERDVALLHVHGTADEDVPYEAATDPHPTPGAVASVTWLAGLNGCAATTTDLGTADLLSRVAGAESRGVAWDGCPSPVSLWTADDGDHLFLTATESFREGSVAFALGGDPVFP